MILHPDENLPPTGLDLGVTFQAEVRIPFMQQAGVDGSVRRMTTRAAFTHGLVLEHKKPGLFAVAA